MQYIVLILLGAGLWLRVYSGPCEISLPGPEAPMFLMLMNLMPDSYVLLSLIGFSLLILQAFLINFVAIRHDLVPKNSLVVAMVFILLMSQSPAAFGLSPLHFAGIFVILAYNRILSSYGTADPTKDIFSAAFLIALASLFHFAAIFLLIILILSLVIFGTFSPRIFLVAIAGVVAVYLYLLVYYYPARTVLHVCELVQPSSCCSPQLFSNSNDKLVDAGFGFHSSSLLLIDAYERMEYQRKKDAAAEYLVCHIGHCNTHLCR